MKLHITTKDYQGTRIPVHQYYHRSLRVWVSYRVDTEGNQMAHCAYDVSKAQSAALACETKLYGDQTET